MSTDGERERESERAAEERGNQKRRREVKRAGREDEMQKRLVHKGMRQRLTQRCNLLLNCDNSAHIPPRAAARAAG